jgi:hypothetical protein
VTTKTTTTIVDNVSSAVVLYICDHGTRFRVIPERRKVDLSAGLRALESASAAQFRALPNSRTLTGCFQRRYRQ